MHGTPPMDPLSHLAAIVASSDDAIVSKTLDGTITSWNPSAERMFGYTAEEMIGQPIIRLIPPERQAEETEILRQLRAGQRIQHYETIRATKDGRRLHVSLTISPVKDHAGHIIGASKIIRDITQRKEEERKSETKQRQQNLLYEIAEMVNRAETFTELYEKGLETIQSLLNVDRAAILLIDEHGVMRFKAWRGLSDNYVWLVEARTSRKKDPSDLCYILVSNIDESNMHPQLQAVNHGEGIHALACIPLTIGTRLIGKLMVYFNQPHVLTEGEVSVSQAIARTLALGIDRKTTEFRLRQSETRLREFAEEMERLVEKRTTELSQSQDRLRALAADLNLTEQRERQRLATELHDYLGQLLALSRMKLDLMKQYPMEEGLAKIFAELQAVTEKSMTYTRTLITQLSPPVLHEFGLAMALQWLADQMQERDLNVVFQSTEIPPLPEDQALLLFQSVRELLLNCVKHAHVRQATLILKQINGSLHITVSDQGLGFDPDTVKLAVKTGSASTGSFGLFSIRERMLSLGGRFDLKASPGKGTVATLVLPITNVPSERSEGDKSALVVSTNETAKSTRMNGSRIRVLVADDHAVVRQGLCSLLAQYEDIEVVGEASNGYEAVEMDRHLQPDVFVMDVTMPKLDGIEATRRIKWQHPAAVVIGLSVHNSPQVDEKMRTAGAAAFLSKETAVNKLYATINALWHTGQSH
jgi:PAS domain S-box-containing protein